MDEKFSVLFWTEFLIGELKFQVMIKHLFIKFSFIKICYELFYKTFFMPFGDKKVIKNYF